MRTNAFGEPRPATISEIVQALDIVDLMACDAQAVIHDSRDEEAPFTGWTAEISHADTGEGGFQTCGFADREGLIAGLEDVGIVMIVED